MKKGEIYYGRKNSDAIHPIVYLRDCDDDCFIGVMLTSSSSYRNNILMAEEHFKKTDTKGVEYELRFNSTCFVNTELIKKNDWKPFRKIGELTEEGIEFVETKISHTGPVIWEDYLSKEK